MNDLISREQAVEEIKSVFEWHDVVTVDRIVEHIKALPSAEPEIIYCQECIKADLCAWRREGAEYCSYARRRTDE